MKLTMNVTGLKGVYETLGSMPQEFVEKRGGPVKLALKKGALFIRDEEKRRLQALINEMGWNDTTGLLMKNIIASRGKRINGSVKGERYIVRVKRKIYAGRQGKPVTTLKTAQIFEYGSVHQPPRPFIRPAFQKTAQQAIQIISEDLVKRIDREMRRMAKKNEGLK